MQKLDELRKTYDKQLHDELDKIQETKLLLSKGQKNLRVVKKEISILESKKKDIVEPYEQVKSDLERLLIEKDLFKTEKTRLDDNRENLKMEEKQLNDLKWRYEILLQKYELMAHDLTEKRSYVESRRLTKRQQFLLKEGTNSTNESSETF